MLVCRKSEGVHVQRKVGTPAVKMELNTCSSDFLFLITLFDTNYLPSVSYNGVIRTYIY